MCNVWHNGKRPKRLLTKRLWVQTLLWSIWPTGCCWNVACSVNQYSVPTCSCCKSVLSSTGLKNDLKTKIFGQHVAAEVILKAVTGFMESKNPKKPLVLSLHGPTGTGKNFMSQFIAENIYKKGMESSFVHLFSVTAHFLNKDQMNTYKVMSLYSICTICRYIEKTCILLHQLMF